MSLGARYERFSLNTSESYVIDGDTINSFVAAKPVFRAGINYQLAKGTFLRSSWGQGYRFPSIAELFIETEVASGIYVFQNPNLKPEEGWSSEVAIKQVFMFGKWKGYIDVAAFIMEYKNMMEFSFGQWQEATIDNLGIGFRSINIGDTEISGLEFTLASNGEFGQSEINIMGGYTYINAIPKNPSESYNKDVNGSDLNYYNTSSMDSSNIFLKYRHEHVVKLDVEYKHPRFSIGTSFKYNSFMKNIDKIFASELFESVVPGIPESRRVLNDGDFIVDARIMVPINEQTTVSILSNNLLNREYQTRPANMMPPRTVSLKFGISI